MTMNDYRFPLTIFQNHQPFRKLVLCLDCFSVGMPVLRFVNAFGVNGFFGDCDGTAIVLNSAME